MRKSVVMAIAGILILAIGAGGIYYLTHKNAVEAGMPTVKRDPISLDPNPPMSSNDIDAIVDANVNKGNKEERK
jgi:hypothetical protein